MPGTAQCTTSLYAPAEYRLTRLPLGHTSLSHKPLDPQCPQLHTPLCPGWAGGKKPGQGFPGRAAGGRGESEMPPAKPSDSLCFSLAPDAINLPCARLHPPAPLLPTALSLTQHWESTGQRWVGWGLHSTREGQGPGPSTVGILGQWLVQPTALVHPMSKGWGWPGLRQRHQALYQHRHGTAWRWHDTAWYHTGPSVAGWFLGSGPCQTSQPTLGDYYPTVPTVTRTRLAHTCTLTRARTDLPMHEHMRTHSCTQPQPTHRCAHAHTHTDACTYRHVLTCSGCRDPLIGVGTPKRQGKDPQEIPSPTMPK